MHMKLSWFRPVPWNLRVAAVLVVLAVSGRREHSRLASSFSLVWAQWWGIRFGDVGRSRGDAGLGSRSTLTEKRRTFRDHSNDPNTDHQWASGSNSILSRFDAAARAKNYVIRRHKSKNKVNNRKNVPASVPREFYSSEVAESIEDRVECHG